MNPGLPRSLGRRNGRGLEAEHNGGGAGGPHAGHREPPASDIEHEILPGVGVAADYVNTRAHDLVFTNDVNYPDPITRVRPNPNFWPSRGSK